MHQVVDFKVDSTFFMWTITFSCLKKIYIYYFTAIMKQYLLQERKIGKIFNSYSMYYSYFTIYMHPNLSLLAVVQIETRDSNLRSMSPGKRFFK